MVLCSRTYLSGRTVNAIEPIVHNFYVWWRVAAHERRARSKQGQGSAPGPRQGALPLGSPPRAEPLEPACCVWGTGGGTEARLGTAVAPAVAGAIAVPKRASV